MAKPKKYISSKLKVKRKFADGGPWKDTEQELYLNGNTTYQAQVAPTAMLQQQFDANEQLKAKQNTAIFGNQLARELDYLQDQNAASEQRKKEEQQVKKEAEQQTVQNAQKQLTTAASLAGKEVAKTVATTGTATNLPSNTAGAVLSKADAKMLGVKSASRFAGQGVSKTSYGSSLANLGVGLGLGLAGEAVGYFGNKRDDNQMKQQGRSQYYDDTNYSRAEFNSQIGKSTLKAAGMGSAFGPVGTGIGAVVGAIYGTGKALAERRKTKSEDERGFKIGDKRFGKKLLFGEENVYDENLDPTVIEKRNREAQLKAMTDTATAMDNARMSSMMQSDLNTGFNVAKYGGKVEYLQGGIAKPLPRGAKEYVGKSHEEGGIDLPNNIEVEGGETEQNNYIFSKHLKLHTGISYAQAHKNLLASGASSEEIKQLALSQEAAAGRNPNEIKTMKFAKYGGPLQYEDGGPKEYSDEVIANAKEMGWGDDVAGYESSGWGYHPSKFIGKDGYKIVYNIAKNAGDPFPEVTAAQWAKESDWGTKPTGKYNYFGQTAKKGESSTSLNTPKDPGGGKKKFVNYENPKDSIVDHVEKWAPKYKNAKSAEEALYILQNNGGSGRYAQGFPTEKFPQGDWEAYVKETLKIIDQQGIKTNTGTDNTAANTKTTNTSGYPTASRYQIPGPHGMMISSDDGISPNAEGMKQIEATARIKGEQDENLVNWGMGALTGVYGGARALVTGAAKKAGQYIDDAMSEEEAASNAAQNAGGARSSSTAVQRTGVPYRNEPINTNLAEFKPFGQNTGLATEGQWMADANAVSAETPGFRIDYGNTAVGPYRGPQYINITGRTVTDPRAQVGLGLDILKPNITNSITNISTYKPGTFLAEQKRKAEENKKPEDQTVTEPELSEDPATGTADTSGLRDKFTLPKISTGPFNRPDYPVRTAEETQKTKEKYDLSELPADKKDYTGLLNLAPALVAGMTPSFKTVTPSLIPTASAGPGAIGRITLNRETDRQLIAENQRTAAAMTEAASMAGGPGGLAAMGRAQLLKSDADLKAAGMVAAKNAEINAREASINAGITGQNLALANQYENRRMQAAAMNANILNTTNQLNTDIKNKEKYLKYATGVETVQSGVENYLGYKKDQDTFKRDKDVAMALDAYHTLERKDIERKLTEASQDKNSKYYGTDPVTVRKMARQYIEEAYPDQMKLGGKKYVSRLGDLVNKRNKRF